jgi:hypothetical protein
MQLTQAKLAIFHFLRLRGAAEPPRFDSLSSREQSALSLWLDHSGLALYFAHKLQQTNALHNVPAEMVCKLKDNLHANRIRVGLLLQQLAQVVSLLEARGVPYAVLKGFSLAPEFCPDPVLRHHTDIDLLLHRSDVPAASAALLEHGYDRLPSLFEDEFVFSTPIQKSPSRQDDIYAPRERKVELHLSFWDPVPGISIESPAIDLSTVSRREVVGVQFFTLTLEQIFPLQLLHLFRHLLGGWIRPSWVYELAYFLNSPHATSDVCSRMLRSIPSQNTANAYALSLSIAAKVFGAPVGLLLQQELLAVMPRQGNWWTQTYAERFLLSDLSGSKLGLLVEHCFATDRLAWRAHLLRRLLPYRSRPHLGVLRTSSRSAHWHHRLREASHFLRRLAFHAASDIELGWELLKARGWRSKATPGWRNRHSGGLLSPPGV